jgi:hypothetical protein
MYSLPYYDDLGVDFSYNFGAENSAEKFPLKMLGKLEFSAEKVLKNHVFF